MQKLIMLWDIDVSDVTKINKEYLSDGWNIKETITFNDNHHKIIFLLEKETRKEKLEQLKDVST